EGLEPRDVLVAIAMLGDEPLSAAAHLVAQRAVGDETLDVRLERGVIARRADADAVRREQRSRIVAQARDGLRARPRLDEYVRKAFRVARVREQQASVHQRIERVAWLVAEVAKVARQGVGFEQRSIGRVLDL